MALSVHQLSIIYPNRASRFPLYTGFEVPSEPVPAYLRSVRCRRFTPRAKHGPHSPRRRSRSSLCSYRRPLARNQPWNLSALRGRVVVFAFGADICSEETCPDLASVRDKPDDNGAVSAALIPANAYGAIVYLTPQGTIAGFSINARPTASMINSICAGKYAGKAPDLAAFPAPFTYANAPT